MDRERHPDYAIADGLVKRVKRDAQFTGSKGLERRWKEFGGEVEPAWDGLAVDIGGGQGSAKTDDLGWAVVSGLEGSAGGWGI